MSLQSWQELARHLEERRVNEVALVNGCFDIFHAGHVGLLKAAFGIGRTVIVALDDDLRIATLKGSGRPVCNIFDRAAVVASCCYVAHVTSFRSLVDYRDMLKALRPDVLVKGEEYRGRPIVGDDLVPRIEFAPQTHSSTGLLSRLDSASGGNAAGAGRAPLR